MNALRQAIAANPRMGSALLGSVLFHLVLLFAVALPLSSWKVKRVAPSEFQDLLHARIVASVRLEEREQPSTPAQVPATDADPEEHSGAVIAQPGPAAVKPAETPKKVQEQLPAQPEQLTANGEPGPPFGVRVREVLFLRPYPRRFAQANPLLNGQGYVRAADLDERPRPLTLVIPDYPLSVLATRTRGWVTVAFFLDEKGEVVHASMVEESEEFQPFESDLIAVLRRSSFTPGIVSGRAVKSITFQRLVFDPEGYIDQRGQDEAPAAGVKAN